MTKFLIMCTGCFIGYALWDIVKATLATYCRHKKGYYVYMPSKDKPTVIHTTYIGAFKEAERLHHKFNRREDVMILKIDTVLEAEMLRLEEG